MRRELLAGRERLAAVTAVLQRIRMAAPRHGIWEAADVQWWWRRPRPSDHVPTPVWFDDDGPVAAALLTAWPEDWTLDLLRPLERAPELDELAQPALDQLALLDPAPAVRAIIRASDADLVAWYEGRGFVVEEPSWSGWLAPADRPATPRLPDGYRLVDRATRGPDVAAEHPFAARNGPQVEARLRETSLYDPRLDLAVVAADGSVAGSSLFWHDPATGVGLVEPVRVEDEHSGRGLGYAMVADGLDRLARAGATVLRIGWETERAGALYARLGFTDVAEDVTYRLVG